MSAEKDNDKIELTETIRSGVERVFEEQLHSKDVDITVEIGTKKGDNYVGIVYRANGKAKSTKNGCKTPKENQMNLIVKVAPQHSARREKFRSRCFFMREIKLYGDVLTAFHRFQESRGIIPDENGFHEFPKCYKTIDSDMNEALIFQDLRDEKFEMFDRFAELTIDHVLLVMRTLGKFHAISFALRDQNPELLKEMSDLPDLFIRKSDDLMEGFASMMLQNAYDALKDPADERLLKKLKDLFAHSYTLAAYQCISSADAEPYAVICHGDCWNNNMLFRYDENGKPVDLKFLDFQISRYASPITDIVYYLFSCTTKRLRDQHYDEILRAYHSSLSQMIKRLGSDPEKLFSYDAMLDQFRKFGKFGLMSAVLLLGFITSASEDTIDMDELAEEFGKGDEGSKKQLEIRSDVYYERTRDVVVDMDRLGYF